METSGDSKEHPLDADIWDDTLLIKAYDKSVNLAREELAKRIACSTNSGTKSKSLNSEMSNNSSAEVFKVGDYVRATYEDGIDYEAQIISINESDGNCLLKYIGYDNEQVVHRSDLVPSWGKQTRCMQFTRAKTGDQNSDGIRYKTPTRKKNKKSKIIYTDDFAYGAIPPPPPMPPMLTENHNLEDTENLSAMLMSWYMSGYYTGVYQGMKIAKSKYKLNK